MIWNLSIPKLERSNHWSSGMDKQLHILYHGFLVTSHSLPPTLCERILQTPSNDVIDSSPCCPTFGKLCNAVATSRRTKYNVTPHKVTFLLSHAAGFVASRFIRILRCVTFACTTSRNFGNVTSFFAMSLTVVTQRIFAAKRTVFATSCCGFPCVTFH